MWEAAMIENLPDTVRLGARFHLHGERHEISFVSRANVRFAACEGGKPRNVPAPAFIKLIANGSVLMVDDNGEPITSTQTRSLERLSDSQLCEMHRRRRYVQEALSAAHPCSKQNLIGAIDRVIKQEAKDAEEGKSTSATSHVKLEPAQYARPSKAPSVATLARWVKRFVAAGRDPLSLVSDSDRRGPRSKRLPDEIEAIIADVISSDYLTPQRPSGIQTYSNLVGKILADPRLASSADIDLPSQRTLLRRIAEIDPHLKTLLRYGRKRADAEFKPAGARLRAIRPV
jgi:putative transposase